eukprot:COSAG02_NODE_204_length_29210_cov_36.596579_6_plen_156_part_00
MISADKWSSLRPDIKCPVILVCRLPRVSLGRVPYPSSLSSNILGRVPLIPLFGRLIGFSNFSISGPSRFRSPRVSILNFPPEIPQDCTGRAVDKSPAAFSGSAFVFFGILSGGGVAPQGYRWAPGWQYLLPIGCCILLPENVLETAVGRVCMCDS